MDDQAQAVGDVEARMLNIMEAEETPSDLEAIDPPAEDVEGEETEVEETEEEAEEATEEITHNGETKVLTKSQLKELAQQGFDYTQKTQAVANERRVIQAQQQALQAQITIHTQLADVVTEVKSLDNQIAQYKQINWSDLAEQDPVQYLKLNQTYRDLKEARDGKAQEYNQQANYLSQVQAQSHAQIKQAEMKMLSQKVPDLVGPKSAANQAELTRYLEAKGFSEHEIGNILDHRMLDVAWEAYQQAKLKSSKPAINKRVAEAPKVVKAKQPANQSASVNRDLREKLRKTGNSDYAAKLIENMI